MHLQKILLKDYKSYLDASIAFNSQVNCILGDNGEGKTNLLDAIYYLCFTKSAFSGSDNQNVRHEQDLAVINGVFEKDERAHKINCGIQIKQKKVFKVDGQELEKMSLHIGEFPAIFISPDDTQIIREGSETRRKFVDGTISQVDRAYLDRLISYNQVLKQRNNLLKNWPEKKPIDQDLFMAFDEQLLPLAREIHENRLKFLMEFMEFFSPHFLNIADGKEDIIINYESQLSDDSFELKYKNGLKRDLFLQRTNMGVHKDDFLILMDGHPLKKFGSQGQQKSVAISLRLAQFDFIKEKRETTPLLLMDDIFDKLDDNRIEKLVALINENRFGQIFITDARPERSRKFFEGYEENVSFFKVQKGEINEITR